MRIRNPMSSRVHTHTEDVDIVWIFVPYTSHIGMPTPMFEVGLVGGVCNTGVAPSCVAWCRPCSRE